MTNCRSTYCVLACNATCDQSVQRNEVIQIEDSLHHVPHDKWRDAISDYINSGAISMPIYMAFAVIPPNSGAA